MAVSCLQAPVEITEDEAKLYDRQIRLWGVSSQKQLRKANVVAVGLSGLGSEAIKNIVLAGINSLTIVDDSLVSESDSLSNLFTRHNIGKNRGEVAAKNIKNLNPMVKITTLDWNIREKIESRSSDFVNLMKSSDVVFITNSDPQTMLLLNDFCHSLRNDDGLNSFIKFFAACDWGYYGFLFSDLGKNYKFMSEEIVQSEIDTEGPSAKKAKKEEVEKVCVSKELDFVPLRTALSVKSGKSGIGITKRTSPVLILTHILFKFHEQYNRFPSTDNRLDDIPALINIQEKVLSELELPPTAMKILEEEKYYDHIFGELSPISTIVGAVLGQDIIRSITNQDAPIRNFFFFDGFKCQGSVESIGK